MKVPTSLGTLEAHALNSADYPGISVGINYNGTFIEFALIEVDQSIWCDETRLTVHVFDTIHDETIFNLDETEDDIKKFFEV